MPTLHVPNIDSANLARINPLRLPLPWLVVVALLMVFLTLKYSSPENTPASQHIPTTIFPHTYLTEVDIRQFDRNGALHYQMNAPLVRSFQVRERPSADDYSLFQTPVFMLFNDPRKPGWLVTAQEGRLDSEHQWFTLTQDVVARKTSEKHGETTLTTANLRLNTQDQFAETSKAVIMRAAKSTITAVGMRADMKREHIELLSHVKGTYEP